MQELRLVAVSEDGTYLVLATAGRGTRFTLPVDDRLRAAVRGHFSRLGQFEIEVESPLRPKEIQARIRAGETAEEIAESAGIPVERVRWFEGPVLQEREYMAQQAQRVTIRRPGESSPGPPLGEMVEERLGRRGVDLEDIEWDSCKCEDNTWRVRLAFFDDGRPHAAEWVFDPRRRHISPLDEEAARLSSLVLEESATDTVTPLVPRRPAMKVVSDPRPFPDTRNPTDSRRERPLEPRRDLAEPRRDYIVERGRMVEPRSQPTPATPPHRETAALPPSYTRPDQREREYGSARGPAGFAPLPPAREIAIPPIEIDETVPAAEGRTRADEASRPNPPAEARAAEPVTDLRTGTEPAASPAVEAEQPEEQRATAPKPAAASRPEPAQDLAGPPDDRAGQRVNERADGRADERADPERERATGPAVQVSAVQVSAAPSPDGAGAEASETAAPAPSEQAAPPGSVRAADIGEPEDVTESGDGVPVRSEDTAVAGDDAAATAATAPAVAVPAEAETREAETREAETREADIGRSDIDRRTAVEQSPAAVQVGSPSAGAGPEPAIEEPAAEEPAIEEPSAPEVAAPAAAKPAEPSLKPAPKPAPAKPAPAAPPATRNRPKPERNRRPEPTERVAQPAAMDEQPAEPAAAAVNGDAVPKPAPRGRRKGSARGKRASVPSWDEIMFGARRPD